MRARVTVVSNGHGEDAIGAALTRELIRQQPDLEIRAYPLVGVGRAYEGTGAHVLGPRRALPAAGLTLHSLDNAMADLRAGWLRVTGAHVADLARLDTDLLLVVGDVYAQLLSAPARSRVRFVYQPLVSILQVGDRPPPLHRRAMERFTWPERVLLRHRAHRVYTRDEPSARWLRAHGVPHAVALGNPAVDEVAGARDPLRAESVALLPGSRGHAPRALAIMLDALATLGRDGSLAWAFTAPPEIGGWAWQPTEGDGGLRGRLVRGGLQVAVHFRDVRAALAPARIALGTAGTASEQAAAVGVPVVSFPMPPEHTRGFLAGQKRLLGDALQVVSAQPAAVADAARSWLEDPERLAVAEAAGRTRMGVSGGTRAIAADMLAEARRRGALPD